jgi:putative sterol carrier protein
MADFPSTEWLLALKEKLNTDEKYGRTAQKWEGDMRFVLDPDSNQTETLWIYIDLWHGTCRDAFFETPGGTNRKPAFTLKAPYGNFTRVLKGELDPMQALMTRKLGVTGNLAVLMRSVPTVLEFVRCCREITGKVT